MSSCLEMNAAAISAVVHLSEYGTRVLMLNGIAITGRIAGKYVVGARSLGDNAGTAKSSDSLFNTVYLLHGRGGSPGGSVLS